MEKMFRVPLKYGGYKYFIGENSETEANAYEVELRQHEIEEKERQKKEQEEKAKAVAECIAKKETKEYRWNQVLDKLESLNKVVESYEKETGEKLEYVTVNGKLTAKPYGLLGIFDGIKLFTNRQL